MGRRWRQLAALVVSGLVVVFFPITFRFASNGWVLLALLVLGGVAVAAAYTITLRLLPPTPSLRSSKAAAR